MRLKSVFLLAAGGLALANPSILGAKDADDVAQIIDEGLSRSQVQVTAQDLLDRIGPRLTNSPNMRVAENWAVREFEKLGLSNVRKEGFEFGRGWEAIDSEVWMVSPRPIKLTAIPVAWTPGTEGTIQGEVAVAPMTKEVHFDEYRGKLKGKIVLVTVPGMGDEPTTVPFRRLEAADIAKLDTMALPTFDPEAVEKRKPRYDFVMKRDAFLKAEGALAVVVMSYRDGKLLHGSGYTFLPGQTPVLPTIEVAAEDYRRLARLAKVGPAPVISINSKVRFDDSDTRAYNIIGEIAGTDPKAGYVMAGAHFDSWAAGDGAVDNASGSVSVIEAARILSKLGKKPRRTIRFVLWSGEEQGLIGSLAYIRQHLVSRAGEEALQPGEAFYKWNDLYPIQPRPGYADLKAYFNMDNGSGKLRGIHAEGNPAAVPLLKKWLTPFAGLGAGSVVIGSTGGTDHVYMQRVGLPGFQFIQDPLDYSARLHHTSIDTFDHLRPDDLRQASTVMAGMLWQAANDVDTLPREALPQQPTATDPFRYKLPDPE